MLALVATRLTANMVIVKAATEFRPGSRMMIDLRPAAVGADWFGFFAHKLLPPVMSIGDGDICLSVSHQWLISVPARSFGRLCAFAFWRQRGSRFVSVRQIIFPSQLESPRQSIAR